MLQYTPYALLMATAMLVSMWLAFILWSKRPGAGIMPFVIMAVGLTIWTFGTLSQLIFTTLPAKVFFVHITYLGITTVPPAWMVFCLAYTGKGKWITRRNILLLLIEPILVQLAILTNPTHLSFWTQFDLQKVDGLIVSQSSPGILFWLHAGYCYMLLVIGCVVLIRTMFRSPQLYRGQMTVLLIGAFTPWIANVVFLMGLSPLPSFVDLTPLAFVVTVLTNGWNMYHFRLLDLVPIARDVIVDNMDDAIVVLDKGKRIVDANLAALTLLIRPTEQVIGKLIADILPNSDTFLGELGTDKHRDTDIQLPIKGKIHYFTLRISSIYNRQQEVSGHILALHDITALTETNQALELANEKAHEATRLKSQFLATMSHELRTPLNAIIGYTELQLTGMVGELTPTQQQYQERVFSNANHLLGLINDILDLSKIEAGRMELIREPFNLREWFDNIIRQNTILAEAKNIEFVSEMDERMPESVVGDAGRLRQIVVNLLSNAIKFTNDGSVKISIRHQDKNTWAVIVEDTGIGIPPHKQETIFDEFHQVDNSSTRQYTGTGLGLAIVRKLALSMGGNIRLTSTLGQGSQFTVLLPLESPIVTETTDEKIRLGE